MQCITRLVNILAQNIVCGGYSVRRDVMCLWAFWVQSRQPLAHHLPFSPYPQPATTSLGLQNHRITGSQAYKITRSQDRRVTRSQVHKITGLQDHRVTGLQDYRVTGSQSYKIKGPHGYKITGPQGYKITGSQGCRITGSCLKVLDCILFYL